MDLAPAALEGAPSPPPRAAACRAPVIDCRAGRPAMLDLLISGGLVIDGSGNPGYFGAVGIEGERLRLFRGTLDGVRGAPHARRHGARGLPRVHRHARPLRPRDPGRAPARAQGAAGRHDRGHRHRRLLVRAVPARPRTSRRSSRSTPASTAARRSRAAGRPWSSTSTCSRAAWPSTSSTSSATPRCACAPSAGTTGPPRRPSWPTMRALLRDRDGGGRLGDVDRSRLPAGELCRHGRAGRPVARRRPGSAASTTPTCATGSGTASSIPSARRSRSAGGPTSPPTSRTSTSGRRRPGGAEQMLGLVEDARESGLDVTFDSYPYAYSSRG